MNSQLFFKDDISVYFKERAGNIPALYSEINHISNMEVFWKIAEVFHLLNVFFKSVHLRHLTKFCMRPRIPDCFDIECDAALGKCK